MQKLRPILIYIQIAKVYISEGKLFNHDNESLKSTLNWLTKVKTMFEAKMHK